ncbi:molybdenum cofactor guanylyltransferase [Desulfosporosinus sp. PR]|uniref:molybdenum cofactor guanylyltransferase n=1 Tax=Candidatus Desulfosporosinus nitrosoreducens TaxID=3401928 RepID=UPI0027FBF7D1|nr:molybdenum cofactor guanylyltransferase [Desulfosporosinus sp. PR]MDQ7093173.1 molybdenum cofactor guanylyltransferase [Desulfosporosinus sp. PR]
MVHWRQDSIPVILRRASKITDSASLQKQLPKLKATGVLLAGGKSSRMGKNKAFLELEGQPLAERSVQVLKEVFSEVLISSNTPELYTDFNVPVIQDRIPDRGPLEGLCQGLAAASFATVFFVACDMPFLQKELIRFQFSWTPRYDIVVPRLRTGLHPLHAFYNRRCLPHIKDNLEAGRLKIVDLYSVCSVGYVDDSDLAGFSDLEDVFCNVNTPEDWSGIFKR